jgi:hypothetical protein
MLSNAKHPRVIIALVIVMVVAIAAVWAIQSDGGLTGPTGNASSEIQNDFANHLDNVHTMNTSAIEGDYSTGASVQFKDATENTGNYTGLKQIGLAYSADIFVNFALPRFSNVDSTIRVDGRIATVDSTFSVAGYDADAISQSARVADHVVYTFHDGVWLISFESWNFDFAGSTAGG